MTFRRKKANYEHISQLEREVGGFNDDSLSAEIAEAVERSRPKKKEVFSPPILTKRSTPWGDLQVQQMRSLGPRAMSLTSYSPGVYADHIQEPPKSKIVIARA